MGEHVSALQLDALAAEFPVDASVAGHLAACAECRSKLEEVKAARAAVMKAPQFQAQLKALRPAPRRPLGFVLALAAAVLLLFIGSRFLVPTGETLLKGAPTVELLKDGAPVTTAKVGQKLTLAVGAAGAAAVAVLTVDGKGEVEVLLPSTPVGPGARVPVGNQLEVTAGSLTVFACFGKSPVDAEALKAELFARAADSKPPDGCAKARLEVVP